jgi:hypothetical protein
VQITLLVHIAAGAVAIVTGYAALAAAKGGRLHRRIGVLFVYAMVVMALFAAWLGTSGGDLGNTLGALLTLYLVVTALTTVRPRTAVTRRVELVGMLVALAIGVVDTTVAVRSFAAGEVTVDGVPAAMILLFGVVALSAGMGDLRMMRAGGLLGARKIARHLWRMCYALWIATGSFFLGQADEFPESLRIWPVLAILAVLPLVAMFYWLWRVRVREALRGMAVVREPSVSTA